MSETLEDVLAELDAGVRELEELPYPQVREQVMRVLQLIDRAHRPGLQAVYAALTEAGIIERVLEDEGARTLFMLYDLAPMDPRTQVEVALEAVRPYVRSHGGEVDVLKVDHGEVHVRLRGTCGTCAASSATLERGVRTALQEGFPGFRKLVAFAPAPDAPAAQGLVQLGAPSFRDLLAFDDLVEGTPVTVDAGANRVLLVRLDDEVYAYEPSCAACGGPLEDGKVSRRHTLVCPFQNCAFDVRSGRRIDGEAGAGLRVFPVAVRDGRVLLAANVEPAALFEAS